MVIPGTMARAGDPGAARGEVRTPREQLAVKTVLLTQKKVYRFMAIPLLAEF